MKRILCLPFALALAAFALAGCGGSTGGTASLARSDIAVVGDQHITRAEYQRLLDQVQHNYKVNKRPFPKPGTPDYATLKGQIVNYLVQRTEYAQRADEMGIDISDKDVDARLKQLKKQFFNGDDAKYQKSLKQQGMTEAQVKADVRTQLVNERIYKKVTDSVKVSDADVRKYYDKHKSQFEAPASRDVRHILVKTKALADRLDAELQANKGKTFVADVKKYSTDPGSKQNGGRYTDTKGSFDPTFEKTAFSLKTNEISQPIHTKFGWHIIQALGPVKPKHTQPLSAVKDQIRTQLEQQEKTAAMRKWVADTKKEFSKRVKYAAGFGPVSAAPTSTG